MMQQILLAAAACLLAGAQAVEFHPLPANLVIQGLKDQIMYCQGKFICSVSQTTTTCLVRCVNADLVCDGSHQCDNGADEHDCPRMCEGKVLCPDKKKCARPCDGVSTCTNGEDEMHCAPKCEKPQLLCSDHVTCAKVCDGTPQCPGREDEYGCAPECLEGRILCADGKSCAIPCNQVDECPGSADEIDCPFQCRCKKGEYICVITDKCVKREDVCEGNHDSNDSSCTVANRRGDDEDNDGEGTRCLGE